MKKHTVLEVPASPDTTILTGLRTTLGQARTALGMIVVTDPRERRRIADQARKLSSALIAGVSQIAAKEGGKVMGIAIDSALADATMAYCTAGEPVVAALRSFADDLETDLLAKRAVVGDPASAVYNAIRVAKRTAEGKALLSQLDELKALRPTKRAKAKDSPPPPPPPEPAAGGAATPNAKS
jgi:hypothetical protein